jgi:general secretion pathway protein C
MKLFGLIAFLAAAFLAADITNQIVWRRIEAASPISQSVPVDSKSLSSEKQATPPVSDDLVVARNIFSAKAREEAVETKGEEVTAPEPVSPPPPLQVSLVGTVTGPPAYAIIENMSTKEQALYRIGDLLRPDEVRLDQIRRNGVVVRRQGGGMELLEVAYVPEERQKSVPPPMPERSHRGAMETPFLVDRREVDAAMENLPKLLTQARLIPHFSGDKPDGFRMISIVPNSLYTKIGLQNGDILHRVNNIEVKDPQNVMQIFEQLKGEATITVDLVRGGQKQTLTYEIR